MTLLRFAICLTLIAAPLWAQEDPASAARDAAIALQEARQALAQAGDAPDRVKALTETVQAYEGGLGALREGLRDAAIQERRLTAELQAREAEVARLLGVLQSIAITPAPVMMLHPTGPVGTARSGMIVAEITPALEAEADELRSKLQQVSTLRALRESAAADLQAGLSGVIDARTRLSQAVADRTDLPMRFTEDPVRTALLIASAETMSDFAASLDGMASEEFDISLPPVTDRKGTLALPVEAEVLRRAGEADAAGITRPGLVLATRPNALVTTPAAATVRYRGPLLDYGTVTILEPQDGILFVLAGMEIVYGEAGQVLPEGAPVGLMGGKTPEIGAILSQTSDGTGTDRTETLYIEVREGKTPVDPELWFRTDKDIR